MLNRVRRKTAKYSEVPAARKTSTSPDKELHQNLLHEENIIEIEEDYFINLNEQIQFLELEVNYLKTVMEESEKCKANDTEAELLRNQLTDCKNEVNGLRLDIKQKNTKIDLLSTHNNKLINDMRELREVEGKQKKAYLDEIVQNKRIIDNKNEIIKDMEDKQEELKGKLEEYLDEIKNLKNQLTEMHEKNEELEQLIQNNAKDLEKLQKAFQDQETVLERYRSGQERFKLDYFNKEVKDLKHRLKQAEQAADHERHMRAKIYEENELLVKRFSEQETLLTEVRGEIEENNFSRNKLEESNKNLVLQIAELKSEKVKTKTEIETARNFLKQLTEKYANLKTELSEQKRQLINAELHETKLLSKIDVLEDKWKLISEENDFLKRENTLAQEELEEFKNQISKKDSEMEFLEDKVVSMQVCLEELKQHNEATAQLQSNRWLQLVNLAQGIQTLSQKAAQNQNQNSQIDEL